MKKLSIVVPCYNEQESLPLFYPAVQKVLHDMPVKAEYWFVDEGSLDHTLQEMHKLKPYIIFLFQEILAKKQQFMQVLKLLREII